MMDRPCKGQVGLRPGKWKKRPCAGGELTHRKRSPLPFREGFFAWNGKDFCLLLLLIGFFTAQQSYGCPVFFVAPVIEVRHAVKAGQVAVMG